MHSRYDILDLENRNKIYEFISKHPGVHQRQIIKKMSFSEGTVKYHLDFLIKKGYIDKNNMQGYTRFYPSKKIGTDEKKLLGLIMQETPRHILIFLLNHFAISRAQLSKELGKDAKTIDYHLKKLIKINLVEPAVFKDGLMLTNRRITTIAERTPVGKEKIYRLKQPYLTYNLLVKYKKAFTEDKITKNALDYIAFLSKGVQPKKNQSEDKKLDRVIKCFFDIFPIPFCA